MAKEKPTPKKPTKAERIKKAVKENDRRGEEAAKRRPPIHPDDIPPGTFR